MKLKVIKGPSDPVEIEVVGERMVIGRDPGCEIVLSDDEVSRQHAAVKPLPDGGAEIEDLGSRNGTYVDNTKLSGAQRLSGGERIEVGMTTLEAVAERSGSETVIAAPGAGAETVVGGAVPPAPGAGDPAAATPPTAEQPPAQPPPAQSPPPAAPPPPAQPPAPAQPPPAPTPPAPAAPASPAPPPAAAPPPLRSDGPAAPPPAPPGGPAGQPARPGQIAPGQQPVRPTDDGLNIGLRILGVIVGLIWALIGVALIIRFFDILSAPLCEDVSLEDVFVTEECYDGSSTTRLLDVLFGLPAGILGVATLPVAIYVAATGKRGRLLLIVGGAAIVLYGLAVLVGA